VAFWKGLEGGGLDGEVDDRSHGGCRWWGRVVVEVEWRFENRERKRTDN